MYGPKSILSIALFAASALANIAFTSVPTNVQAGQSYTITWSGEQSGQPVTISLREGPSSNLGAPITLTSK
jgi:Ser-Thr-rich glycosyl-phosphatidyl-inositol-anchored membrane family